MDWNDVAAALRAGASPEDVLTHTRTRTQSQSGSTGEATRESGRGAGAGVDRLYRTGLGQSLQLCYLHTPLHVLELLDGDGGASSERGNGGVGVGGGWRADRFDGELSFDVLDGFSPRLVGCVPEDSVGVLSRARTSTSRSNKSLRRGSKSPSDAASVYTSYKRPGVSSCEAALCALRDMPSIALAAYVAREVIPQLSISEQGRVGIACREAAGGAGRLNASAVRAAVEAQGDNALQAVCVLDALLGSGDG